MGCCLSSASFCCCSVLCCECNCILFPAPDPSYGETLNFQEEGCKLYHFTNSSAQKVPYMQISSQKSRSNPYCMIYFHGNAQDIGYSINLLQPIHQGTNTTIYVIQYPTYGSYQVSCTAFISNKIKSNSLEFYKHLQTKFNYNKDNIIIMGRSIGSGGAVYLASRVQAPKLILISPFDSIREVARDHVGRCLGTLVKNHFDNITEIDAYNGKLLVIHGVKDEVIGYSHGNRLATNFEENHSTEMVLVSPPNMTHNRFDIHTDIIAPIVKFLR